MARRSSHAKKIDNVHWIEGGWSVFTLAAGTVASTVFAAQHLPETLMRLRGRWSGLFDGVAAPARGVFLTVGMILVPEGTGTTVLWSPSTDSDAPWLWWDVLPLIYEENVADVVASQNV